MEDFYDQIEEVHQLVRDKFSSSGSLFSQFINDTKTVLQALAKFDSIAQPISMPELSKYNIRYPNTNIDLNNLQAPRLLPQTIPSIPEAPTVHVPNISVPNLLDLSLYNDLITKIRYILTTGETGIPNTLEDNIMNKAIEREHMELAFAEDKVISTWASRGFTMPNDLINEKLSEIREKFYYQRLQTSREIAIKRYEIAFEAMKIAFSIGSDLIKAAISLLDILPKVLLEAEKLKVEGYIAYLNGIKAKIDTISSYNESATKLYASMVQAEATKAQVQENEVRLELSAIELEIRKFIQEVQLQIENKKTELYLKLEQAKVSEEHQKAIATLYSNVSAAILQSMNTLVQLSSSYHASGPIEAPA